MVAALNINIRTTWWLPLAATDSQLRLSQCIRLCDATFWESINVELKRIAERNKVLGRLRFFSASKFLIMVSASAPLTVLPCPGCGVISIDAMAITFL